MRVLEKKRQDAGRFKAAGLGLLIWGLNLMAVYPPYNSSDVPIETKVTAQMELRDYAEEALGAIQDIQETQGTQKKNDKSQFPLQPQSVSGRGPDPAHWGDSDTAPGIQPDQYSSISGHIEIPLASPEEMADKLSGTPHESREAEKERSAPKPDTND